MISTAIRFRTDAQTTIGEFVDWCWTGLKAAGVSGEVIIVDSSTDDTPNITFAKGARVLRTQKGAGPSLY
jgi:hypothetical protein